jgi:hypothetical protein
MHWLSLIHDASYKGTGPELDHHFTRVYDIQYKITNRRRLEERFPSHALVPPTIRQLKYLLGRL